MFRYQHPEYLYLLATIPLAAIFLRLYWGWRREALARLGRPEQVERLIPGFSTGRFWLKNTLFLAALAFLILAWANPQRGAKKQTVSQRSSDVFIALDISNSMLAEDIPPSRLDLAKVFAQKVVKALEGERIGLIFFAGNAFLQAPLSNDHTFLIQSLQSAEPDLITSQGTAIPAAIELAKSAYESGNGAGRALILITDGENHDEDAVEAAEAAFDDGIVVLPVGAGTPEGGFIPTGALGASRYKRDESGELIRSRLDEELLKKLALAGGSGTATNIRRGDKAVQAIVKEVGNLEKRQMEVRSYSEMESYFQWFLLPALLLLWIGQWVGQRAGKSGQTTKNN
jgi:Ca-activated chloride channel homolog